MAFWEDLSSGVKGVVVVGVLALLYFGIAFAANLPPFGGGVEDTTTERGLPPPPGS